MRFVEFVESRLLTESVQSIVGLYYPEVIGKLLQERFGKNAYLIARWYRDFNNNDPEVPKNWWLQSASSFRGVSLYDLTYLYGATKSPEEYKKALIRLDIEPDEDDVYDEYYLQEQRDELKKQIEHKFFDNIFFKVFSIVEDIASGKLKNVAPYKNLRFLDAQHRYESGQIFDQKPAIKSYENGFKWINVGPRCHLLGDKMSNCGSAGVMSNDPDKTLLGLFGPDNTPHVVVTYSPNEKRISGDEGRASSEVKEKYHSYILDLANVLGVNFDTEKSKSTLLKLKYLLRNKTNQVQKISNDKDLFRFSVAGKEYYTNGYMILSKDEINKVVQALANPQVPLKGNDPIEVAFNHMNTQYLKDKLGVNYQLMFNFTSIV